MKLESPQDFDWVTECGKCSLKGAFVYLREVVDSDIKRINKVDPKRSIEFSPHGDTDKFIVFDKERSEAVAFEVNHIDRNILVRNGTKTMFYAKPEIRPGGDCWLKVNDAHLRFWEVSKKALEDLFFRS